MIPKPTDKIDRSDIEALVVNKAIEGRTLEYKLLLPGGRDEDKREFLADVSSFANASGGDLIFGVSATVGVPTGVPGLPGVDIDAEKLRLEEVVRNGVDPRIVGLQVVPIIGGPGPALLLRIPRSFNAPHMVTFKGTSRFFTRNSAGKYQMDVTELRIAFDVSGSVSQRLQNFKTDRLGKIVAGETPIALPAAAKLVLHILPLPAFTLNTYISSSLQQTLLTLRPIATGSWDVRHNLDGLLTYGGATQDGLHDSYCQFFRDGRVEAVYADLVVQNSGEKLIGSTYIEQHLIQAVGFYLQGLKGIQVPMPLLVTVSLLGVRGVKLETGIRQFRNVWRIDRDSLLLPDVILEQYDVDISTVMRPIFDALWNAGGYERSFSYDQNGIWKPR